MLAIFDTLVGFYEIVAVEAISAPSLEAAPSSARDVKTIIYEIAAVRMEGTGEAPSMATKIGVGALDLDSIALLEFFLEIEARTNILARSEDLSGDCLATLGSLIRFFESSSLG